MMRRALVALLLGACLCGGCGLHIPDSPGAPDSSPPEISGIDKADLAECRRQKAVAEKKAAEYRQRVEVLTTRIRELEIARVQAWLNWLALAAVLLAVGFAVLAVWVAPIRKIVLYVTGGLLTLALALKFLAIVWPWFTILAIAAAIVGGVALAWYIHRIREGKADWFAAFKIASNVADGIGDSGELAAEKTRLFIEQLAKSTRLDQATLSKMHATVKGG